MEDISENVLKNTYDVKANFYQIKLANKLFKCRNVLEITSKNYKLSEENYFEKNIPDAIFIMMNPGKSHPLTDKEEALYTDLKDMKIYLIETEPDTTQYQIMRLMQYFEWQHIRVINLSDIRNKESSLFQKEYKEAEGKFKFNNHSIFDPTRINELNTVLRLNPKTHLICAWGVSDNLVPLILKCIQSIKKYEHKLLGLKKTNTKYKYYHPLPHIISHRKKWLDDMIALIENTLISLK